MSDNQIEFEAINIAENDDAREFLISSGHRTIPQIYLNGELFVDGGLTGLNKMSIEQVKNKIAEVAQW